MNRRRTFRPLAAVLLATPLLTTPGCDDRALKISREAADRQAAQNETMAHLQGEVAAGTRRLAEEESRSRRQALQLHRDLQAERADLHVGWNDLQAQRQTIADRRRTESLLAVLASGGGGAAVAALALAFAWLALHGVDRRDDAAQAAVELLLADPELLQFPMSPPIPRCAAAGLAPVDGPELLTDGRPSDPSA